ncbi:unnamed protein product, partial [Amoebophrya sp. A120]
RITLAKKAGRRARAARAGRLVLCGEVDLTWWACALIQENPKRESRSGPPRALRIPSIPPGLGSLPCSGGPPLSRLPACGALPLPFCQAAGPRPGPGPHRGGAFLSPFGCFAPLLPGPCQLIAPATARAGSLACPSGSYLMVGGPGALRPPLWLCRAACCPPSWEGHLSAPRLRYD